MVENKVPLPSKPRSNFVGGTTVVPYGARGNTATEICAKVPSLHARDSNQEFVREGEVRWRG